MTLYASIQGAHRSAAVECNECGASVLIVDGSVEKAIQREGMLPDAMCVHGVLMLRAIHNRIWIFGEGLTCPRRPKSAKKPRRRAAG